ncbi:MAG: AIR synthase related protein [bacterium]
MTAPSTESDTAALNADLLADFFKRFNQHKQDPASGFPIHTIRDLLAVELFHGLNIIIASDSTGGIGPKEHDSFPAPGYLLGRFAVRVPLMEMVAAGATPLLVVDTLSVEMSPTGEEIIRGVREEVEHSGLAGSKVVTGSTEDNVPTVQTGMGVVVIGLAEEKDLRPGNSRAGDAVVCVGFPKSAPEDEVRLDDPEIADVACVRTLSQFDFIHDILPVGSHGSGYEIGEMARTANLKAKIKENNTIPLKKTGGPSTCIIVSMEPDKVEMLRNAVRQPITVVGEMIEP